jgi:hypothetical protein
MTIPKHYSFISFFLPIFLCYLPLTRPNGHTHYSHHTSSSSPKFLHPNNTESIHSLPLALLDVGSSDAGNGDTWRLRFKGTGTIHLSLDLKLGFLMGSERKPGDVEYSRPGQVIAGGLTTSLVDLAKQRDFFGKHTELNLDLKMGETFGDEERSLKAVAAFWRDWNVSVVIGPQETCVYEAKLAASLNIPMISYVRTENFFSRDDCKFM